MRNFTALFLLALAMTIGASQAFAHEHTNPNDTGAPERPDPRDDGPNDDGPNDDGDDDDGDDPLRPRLRLLVEQPVGRPCLTAAANFDCPPPRRLKEKLVLVQKEPEDCGCEHKVIRVGARFVTVIDCYYQAISVNGRPQTLYCTKDK